MKLLCWNCNGLQPVIANIKLRFGSLKGFFEKYEIDVGCLQEAKIQEKTLSKELCCIDGFQSFWACSSVKRGYSGVTTYISIPYAPVYAEIDSLNDDDTFTNIDVSPPPSLQGEGRIVITDLESFILINVYVPNSGDASRLHYKLRFLRALRMKCLEYIKQQREVVLVGDFNIALSDKDVHPTFNVKELYSEEERNVLQSFLLESRCMHSSDSKDTTPPEENVGLFIDVWRYLHPDESSQFTVWNERTSARTFNQGVRIDYVLSTPGLIKKIKSCEVVKTDVIPPKWSDHAGILVEFDVEGRGKSNMCDAWTKLYKRFHDSTQRNILSMFGGGGGGGSMKMKKKTSDSIDAGDGEKNTKKLKTG